MNYDKRYSDIEHVFGADAEEVLVDHCELIDRSRPVLDIGAGQGRNTVFLARHGFHVDAIDPSTVGTNQLEAHAVREDLPIRVFTCGFDTFSPDVDSYSAIAVFGILQLLPPTSIELLVEKILTWTGAGSIVFLTGFTTTDPGYEKVSRTAKRIERHSFRNSDGGIRTYLEPGEILGLLPDFDVIHHWEGMGPEHRHGAGPPERHAMAEAVLRHPSL